MSLTKYTASTAIIAALADLPNATDGLSAAQLKAKFDENPENMKVFINNLIDELSSIADGSSGADQIGATPISNLNGNTVQSLLESIRDTLKSTTDSASGADFIGATAISGITGSTVQSLIEGLKSYLDNTFDTSTDITSNRKLSPTGDFTGTLNGAPITATDPGLSSTVNTMKGAGPTEEKTNLSDFNAHVAKSVTTPDDKKLKVVACVIRNEGAGWYIIDDENHTPIGVTSVAVNGSNQITLSYNIGASKVVCLQVTPDEEFASKGIFCGASVQKGGCGIELYASLKASIDTSVLTTTDQPFSSIIGTTIQAKLDGSRILITHGNSGSDETPVVNFRTNDNAEVVTIIARTTTSTSIRCYKDYIGRWYYDGEDWIEELSNMNAGAVSVNWSSGRLVVSHPSRMTNMPNMISGVGTNIVTNYTNLPSTTSFSIQFLDDTLTPITPPVAGMRVDMRISGVSQIASGALLSSLGTMRFSGLHTKLDPNEISSATGNLWIEGLMYFE